MDPVTVLALTCNVLQLVETGYKGLALCWRLYRDGEDVEKAVLKDTCESLSQGHKRLQTLLEGATSSSSKPDGDDLLDLCTRCQRMSSDLIAELNGLILPAKSNVVRAIGKALKTSLKASTIQRLTSQLGELRQVLDSRILIST